MNLFACSQNPWNETFKSDIYENVFSTVQDMAILRTGFIKHFESSKLTETAILSRNTTKKHRKHQKHQHHQYHQRQHPTIMCPFYRHSHSHRYHRKETSYQGSIVFYLQSRCNLEEVTWQHIAVFEAKQWSWLEIGRAHV